MSKDAARNAEREARLAEALRANLRKRKAQRREAGQAADGRRPAVSTDEA